MPNTRRWARRCARREAQSIWPAALAAARFLALTGWRTGEALGLRWDEIDLARRTATLGDTKTGRSVRPLSHAACDVLRSLTQRGRTGVSGDPRRWPHGGLSEAMGAHCEAWANCRPT